MISGDKEEGVPVDEIDRIEIPECCDDVLIINGASKNASSKKAGAGVSRTAASSGMGVGGRMLNIPLPMSTSLSSSIPGESMTGNVTCNNPLDFLGGP